MIFIYRAFVLFDHYIYGILGLQEFISLFEGYQAGSMIKENEAMWPKKRRCLIDKVRKSYRSRLGQLTHKRSLSLAISTHHAPLDIDIINLNHYLGQQLK